MEGPSLFLAQEQLQPFIGQKILTVSGNSKIGIERLQNETVKDIFAWGKHLVYQFDTFAIRVHFLLFGTFAATVEGKSVTGDYKKKDQEPRLMLEFANGQIEMFSCSVKVFEDPDLKKSYDFTIDVMSQHWDPKGALMRMIDQPDEQIADILLDQTIFAGVGNIIKNEVLFIVKTLPTTQIKDLSPAKLREIIKVTQEYSHQFLAWRKEFQLRKTSLSTEKKPVQSAATKLSGKKPAKSSVGATTTPVTLANSVTPTHSSTDVPITVDNRTLLY